MTLSIWMYFSSWRLLPLDSRWPARWRSAWTCSPPGRPSRCCAQFNHTVLSFSAVWFPANTQTLKCHDEETTVGSKSTAGRPAGLWTQICACTTWAGGWSWGVAPLGGLLVPGSLRGGGLVRKDAFEVGTRNTRFLSLTQLSALARRLEQQLQLVQRQRHVHGVAAQSLHSEQEGHRCLELRGQEQHLEVQEGLLAGREMGLSCWE